MSDTVFHSVIIVGAGPGGLSIAASLSDMGVQDVHILDRGRIGQSWLDYPPETRLLSESGAQKDDNMIAGINVWDVQPNIPHPTHVMYQKYLAEVAKRKNLQIHEEIDIDKVEFDENAKQFILSTTNDKRFSTNFLIWAAGMYSTPDEKLDSSTCFIHYSRIQDWKHITENSVSVVGGANGASEVVIQLAKPERTVRLICSKEFDVPLPIDCLWKENRQLIKDLENQGLVEIIENFRVKKISHDDTEYTIESTEGRTLKSPTRPIVCIGFLPNIDPVKEFVDTTQEGHDVFLTIDDSYQSKKQPGLFFGGTIAKLTHEEGFIRHFREYGEKIAKVISKNLTDTDSH